MFRKVFALCLLCLVPTLLLTGCLSTKEDQDQQTIKSFLFNYKLEAEQGDISKQINLAMLDLTGYLPASMQEDLAQLYQIYPPYPFIFDVDRNHAFYWLEKAVSTKNVDALALYGELLLSGYDESKYAYGFEMTKEAMALGNKRAKALVGANYALGSNHVKQNVDKAKQIIQDVPQESYSKYALASMYYYGYGFKKDVQKALALANEAANDGLAEAMYLIATIYTFDKSIEPSAHLALDWSKKAYLSSLNKGVVDAYEAYILAHNLVQNPYFDEQYGDITKQALQDVIDQYDTKFDATAYNYFSAFALNNRLGLNYWEGLDYAQHAANLGDKPSQEFMANFRKELNTTISKAEKGDSDSQVFLMNYYYFAGDNFVPNPIKSVEYANKLAQKNNPYGLLAIACMHLEGKYLPKNPQRALDYMQRAANLGEPNAVKFINEYQSYTQQQQNNFILQASEFLLKSGLNVASLLIDFD